MKYPKFLAALLLALSTSAFANASFGTLSSTPLFVLASVNTWYDFTLSGQSTFNGMIGDIFGMSSIKVVNKATNAQQTFNFANPYAFSNSFAFSLGAGTFSLYATGSAYSLFAGTIGATPATLSAPVPEPENYAMLALGICGIGFLSSRRRQR